MRDILSGGRVAEIAPEIGQCLLAWYDTHARELPWRVPPQLSKAGVLPDAYHIWLSEVMLQQTTVAVVGRYFLEFLHRWPKVEDLAAASDDDVMAAWAGLGYYARARNLLKCARVVAFELGGHFPQTRKGLMALPGIGPYTSAAISAIAFGQPETVVDGNVERVMARLFAVEQELPASKAHLHKLADGLTPDRRAGDHAQAMMDLGATVCTPRKPACGGCPLRGFCLAADKGIAAELPRRGAKARKPTRQGVAYVARRVDGAVLMVRRPGRGLLGGMLGWPGDPLGENGLASPPLEADWQPVPGEVRHTFTHFHLRMNLWVAEIGADITPTQGEFLPPDIFDPNHLPSVMRKAWQMARPALQGVES